jgi:hypothetical protein
MHDKVLTEKTFDFLIENINVKYTEPTEETEEKEEENSKED